ncbi:DUF308 domain-containing protein [Moraxellaceae bacterium AER2_44_116]|nr:DUF308 domain-containing protein [Moraxellaceae bacterium]TQC98440.1 DUF308 domain-containing protein [Moraxellaceae bacterium AER2_44_116]
MQNLIFKSGIAVGLILVLLGIIVFVYSSFVFGLLILCAGLGIILGAFGSTAQFNAPSQGIVLTGVAAITIGLFWVTLNQLNNRYVLIKIVGDIVGAQVELVGDRSYLGAFEPRDKNYNFVVFGVEIERPFLSLYITTQPDKKEFIFECITKDKIKPYLASGKTIEWRFNKTTEKIVNIENNQVIAENKPCSSSFVEAFPQDKSSISSAFGLGLFSTAFAAESSMDNDTAIIKLIEQLESDTSYVRRLARSQLAAKGSVIVEPLLAKLSVRPISYSARLGVVVSLTEMLRVNKKYRTEIIKKITENDLSQLVSASIDDDRTIRIYASEFLYDLGDPRILPIALNKFSTASDNGKYNLLLVIKGAMPFALGKQKSEVIKRVSTFKLDSTPKINGLIDSIVESKP